MIETGCGGGLSVEYPEVPRGPGAFVYGGDVACDQDWPEQPEEGSVFAIMGTRTELFFGGGSGGGSESGDWFGSCLRCPLGS